ncbi:alkylphosphocholine resistance protein lem3 [Conoideocrella luteorostrata]|uniref:Alkylphosphocholine resistance protein lem3 n=1 Tax=Conoideocrella luteorostrata TaxID=1105319 RepID=A0AAJ0CD82_9HYPO|nr:alkylphosphocholine resistance protein lem3 [Conoideocrella luteorostrata]
MSDSPRGVGHTDSIDSHDSTPKQPEKQKSRRPPNTAFRQQRLKAWQPILTPKTVLPLFFTIGIIFAPIGGLLLYASSKVQEIKLDYTNCIREGGDYNNEKTFNGMPDKAVQTAFKSSHTSINARWSKQTNVNITLYNGVNTTGNKCYLQFNIPERMEAPVLFYYHLTNFYQNHRRYAESCDLNQLKGDARSYGDITGSKCTPLYGEDKNGTKKPYYPCGLIANSMFNDTFGDPVLLNAQGSSSEGKPYKMTNKGIAWDSDKDLYGPTKYKPADVLPPPNWAAAYPGYEYTDEHPPPNLKEWEDFQVWMRTAGLPVFSKLYKRNDEDAMAAGTYEIVINDFFPAAEYDGSKSVLITTRTVMGGRNNFLGIAYIAVGGVCILLGAIFTATHLIRPRKLGDHTYLSWNNTPASKPSGPSAATASGRDIRPGES